MCILEFTKTRVNIMKKILLVLLVLCLVSCARQIDRMRYVDNHKELSEEKKEAIGDGKVIEGMNVEEVIVTWGQPFHFEMIEKSRKWRYLNYLKVVEFKGDTVVSVKPIPYEFKQAYDNGSIAIDMTFKEVEYMWGSPTNIGKEKRGNSLYTFWVYDIRRFPHYKVTFEGNKVISFKDMDAE